MSKVGEKRPKTGGRAKGTPNKTTAAFKDAIVAVYADLQAETDTEHGHFFAWAKDAPTEFYKLASKLIPIQLGGEGGGPIVTRLEIVGVRPDGVGTD